MDSLPRMVLLQALSSFQLLRVCSVLASSVQGLERRACVVVLSAKCRLEGKRGTHMNSRPGARRLLCNAFQPSLSHLSSISRSSSSSPSSLSSILDPPKNVTIRTMKSSVSKPPPSCLKSRAFAALSVDTVVSNRESRMAS